MEEYLVDLRIRTIELFEHLGVGKGWAILLQSVVAVIGILILAWLADKLATFLMRRFVPKLVGKTRNEWDDIFLQNRVFANLSHFLPGFVMLVLYPLIASRGLRVLIRNVMDAYFVIACLLFFNALINAFSGIYANYKGERAANIKIYLQVLKVLLFSLGGIVIISIFADKKFIDILTGLGAMITILLIVYKDTIMGFVAGIQLSANKMLKVGDWIAIPQDNADGTVIDISLNTVKVQNWDKTITTVPTYSLISKPFINWKGMSESGGRRIRRFVNIDLESVHFLSNEEISKFRKMKFIEDYMAEKIELMEKCNVGIEESFNQKHLTNIGVFRAYIEHYLKASEFANLGMAFAVRQLQSTEKGVPVEVYLFSKEKEWAVYEGIQSDIFDHIFAIVPEFNLRIFQDPTGYNVSKIQVGEYLSKK